MNGITLGECNIPYKISCNLVNEVYMMDRNPLLRTSEVGLSPRHAHYSPTDASIVSAGSKDFAYSC